jgi:hypothetical protein
MRDASVDEMNLHVPIAKGKRSGLAVVGRPPHIEPHKVALQLGNDEARLGFKAHRRWR